MRLEIVQAVFMKELRETLRDRRSIAVMFGIPLLLYPLLMVGFAGLGISTARRMNRQISRIAVVNAEAAPRLVARMRRELSGVRIVPASHPEAALAANRIDAIIIVPPRCEADALAMKDPSIRIQLDRSRTTAPFTQRKLDRLLNDYEQWIIRARLRARGMSATLARPLAWVTDDVATSDRRLGSMLGRILPMMLLLTGMLGAFFPAVNATTAERELGTLETLLVTPATKMELLLAKGALVFLSALLTAGLNMLSMSLMLWRTFSMTVRGTVALAIDPGALALSYLAAVPTILFFAAIVLVVGLFARNFREANAYATPVMLLPMVPLFVSITEPKATPGLLVTPTVNTTLVIRDVLAGQATASAFLIAFVSSCLYAGLAISLAARLFTTEQLVNPAWEPLSVKGLRHASRRSERRLPAIDEALALFAFSLLLLLYVSPSWMQWGFLPLLAGNEILLIAAPALLFAWLGRYRWVETFAWRRPTAAATAGAVLLGLGALPWVYALAALQERVWPQDPETVRATLKLMLPALHQHPVFAAIAAGALAGICEEFLFRGPIQTALMRRLPAGIALTAGAILFAAAHLDLQGMLFRTLFGLMLGWVVWRGGSIFPAMLMHAAIDSTHFGVLAWSATRPGAHGAATEMELATRAGAAITGTWPIELAIGTALLLIGWLLFRHEGDSAKRPHRRDAEDAEGAEEMLLSSATSASSASLR